MQLATALLDVPLYDNANAARKAALQKSSTAMIEALHVLFTLYLAFKESDHFAFVAPS